MRDLSIDDDLIGWTQSFLTDRSAKLVIDGFTNARQKIELTADRSISRIAMTLEKVRQIVLEWGANNAVTYVTSKTEAVLFNKTC